MLRRRGLFGLYLTRHRCDHDEERAAVVVGWASPPPTGLTAGYAGLCANECGRPAARSEARGAPLFFLVI